MATSRRSFLVSGAAAVTAIGADPGFLAQDEPMYGLIGKMNAVSGKRDELIAILLEGIANMPGCLSYIVSRDAADANAIWITEVWDSKASHEASLTLPSVRAAIARGKPLIAAFSDGVVTAPVGGHGLTRSKGL